jgi:hypothetical protein
MVEGPKSVRIWFRKISCRQQCLQPHRNHLLEKHYATGELASVLGLAIFVQATSTDERRKSRDIVREENGIMQQFLVAFLAVHLSLALISPRTDLEDSVSLGLLPIRRTSEAPLGYIVMLGRM